MTKQNTTPIVLKWGSLTLGLVGMLITVVIWISTEHTEIKESCDNSIIEMKKSIKADADKYYAEKADTRVLKELLNASKEDIQEMRDAQKSQGKKIDDVHKFLLRRSRNR